MKPKTIISAIVIALILIILFNNKEEASFWLFTDIKTSKLFILGAFFLIGVLVGAIVFRRKNKHPKEYGVTNPNGPTLSDEDSEFIRQDNDLTDEDREYIRRD